MGQNGSTGNSNTEEEHVAAEDFRRQLQERLSGDQPSRDKEGALQWVDANSEVWAEIEPISWGPGKHETHLPAVREQLERVPLTSPHDEPFTHAIMQTLCEEVEAACRALDIPLQSGVAYGATPSFEINAVQYSVPLTDASVITLSQGFINFFSHISKMFSLSLLHEPEGEVVKVSFEPSRVFKKIRSDPDLKYYWTEVIGAYAFGSGPINVKHRLVPYPHSITRAQLLWAIECFSVAHEYAHHVARDGGG